MSQTAVHSEQRERPASPGIVPSREPLRVLGTSVTQIGQIMRAAEEDLGLRFEFITLDGAEAQRRGALQPGSFDVYDQWFHDLDLIWPTASIQPIDIDRITRWDEINDLPKTGRIVPEAPRASGGDPSRRLFVQLDGSLGEIPSDHISMLPTVHNADSFAVVGHPADEIASWGVLLDPDWSGRVILQADAAIGCIDMLLALRSRGELRGADAGDLSVEEIDWLVERLRDFRAQGHFRTFWNDEAEAIAAIMEADRLVGSLWWSGIVKLRARGVPVNMVTPREGYRGWYGGLALSSRLDGWALDAAYDYLNWWLDGRPGALMARIGAYMSNPSAVRPWLSDDEWSFWYAGRPAAAAIRDPDGNTVFREGESREGGEYAQRMARVVVWDTVMDEHNYLVRRWDTALNG